MISPSEDEPEIGPSPSSSPVAVLKIELRVSKLVSAPLNAYTRLVLVGTMPPQMREVCQLEWNAKKEKRFQRFAATMRALNPPSLGSGVRAPDIVLPDNPRPAPLPDVRPVS